MKYEMRTAPTRIKMLFRKKGALLLNFHKLKSSLTREKVIIITCFKPIPPYHLAIFPFVAAKNTSSKFPSSKLYFFFNVSNVPEATIFPFSIIITLSPNSSITSNIWVVIKQVTFLSLFMLKIH